MRTKERAVERLLERRVSPKVIKVKSYAIKRRRAVDSLAREDSKRRLRFP